MKLSSGTRIGSYEVLSHIGVGGMGDVYRARDTKLNRDVALKVLPRAFAADPDRLARFTREAQILASLNHPLVAQIYGVQDSEEIQALILELVDGPTLADRVATGPLLITEAVAIAHQIAVAIEAAHELGIVHRDLKPANIKVRPDGVVKVLDFGLAKARDESPEFLDLTNAETTMRAAVTATGVILGTTAYMSPEQARGQKVDRRTDIWAFGCVMFETLTGRPVFARDTITDTLSAVVDQDPDWAALPPATPIPLRRLLQRCLEKSLKRRLRDIGDAVMELEDLQSARSTPVVESPATRRTTVRAWRLAGVVAVVISAAAFAIWQAMSERAGARPVALGDAIASRLTNYDGTETGAAIAPDGRSFVFVSSRAGDPDLWLRRISGGEPVRLTNDDATESDLIFAPDGETVYYTRSLGGGTTIWQVGALGGRARKVLDDARAPSPSADGRHLAWFTPVSEGTFALIVGTIDGNERRQLVTGIQPLVDITRASWSADGRLLAYTSGGLFAPRNLFGR